MIDGVKKEKKYEIKYFQPEPPKITKTGGGFWGGISKIVNMFFGQGNASSSGEPEPKRVEGGGIVMQKSGAAAGGAERLPTADYTDEKVLQLDLILSNANAVKAVGSVGEDGASQVFNTVKESKFLDVLKQVTDKIEQFGGNTALLSTLIDVKSEIIKKTEGNETTSSSTNSTIHIVLKPEPGKGSLTYIHNGTKVTPDTSFERPSDTSKPNTSTKQ